MMTRCRHRPATVTVAGRGRDPMLGMSHARIGQWSRQFHRTQGMGSWIAVGAERDWPLHLAWSRVGDDSDGVSDNLPRTLGDLGLDAAQQAVDAALAAFPDLPAMCRAASRAFSLLGTAPVAPVHAHRVSRKMAQLARLIRLTSGVEARARPARSVIAPGETVAVSVEIAELPGVFAEPALIPAPGLSVTPDGLTAAHDAPPTDPYPDSYDPLSPRAPALSVALTVKGVTSHSVIPFEAPVATLPGTRAQLSEARAFVNLATSARRIDLSVGAQQPRRACLRSARRLGAGLGGRCRDADPAKERARGAARAAAHP